MKTVKLKNIYNGEIVYCKNFNDVVIDGTYKFVKVYKEELPQRIYLVNKDSYILMTK